MSILRRQPENGFLAKVGVELLAVDEIGLAPLVKSDGHLQDEEEIISGSTNATEDICYGI